MPFNKEDNMVLKAEARYNPLFDSGIVFYNLDTNNRLGFQMTRKNVIVPLSEINVQSYISLIAQDGSSIVDNLKFENELQGVLSYRIPAEFLKHTGNVHAEVHITTNGKDDTVVMGEFDFEIKDASINKLPADMKIGYIRMFDDLKKTIEQKVADIQQAIANGQDYVTAIQNASADAKQTINSSVAGAKAEIDTKITAATADLSKTATDAKKAITDTGSSTTKAVNDAMTVFHNDLANNGFLKPSDVAGYQKFKAILDNGNIEFLNDLDFNDIGSKITTSKTYVVQAGKNPPKPYGSDTAVSNYGVIAVKTASINIVEALYRPYNSTKEFKAMKWNGTWGSFIDEDTPVLEKMETLKTLMLRLAPAAESGGVKLSISSSEDVLTAFANAPTGIYGVYVQGGATNSHPSGGACRGIAMKSAADIGFLKLVNTKGVTATNYLNSTLGWSGWEMPGGTLLWSGSTVASKGTVFWLSQSRENFKFIKMLVVINLVGEDIVEMNARGTNNGAVRTFNNNDDGSGTINYELLFEKTAANKLTVLNEARYNPATNNGLVNNNDWTIKEIWGVN